MTGPMVGGKIRAEKKLNLEPLDVRKSHPVVSSPGLFASPWPPVAARAKDKKVQTAGQTTQQASQQASKPASKQASKQASMCFKRAERPATRSDWHNPGTPLPPNPGRLASAISNSCTSVVPRSSHGRPSAWTMCGNHTHGNRSPSAAHAGEAPVSTLDVYQIRNRLCFPRLCNTKDCSGTCKPPRRGLTVALLLLISLLRTPTEPTLSYHILCPSRAITHTPGGRTTARHTFPGPFYYCAVPVPQTWPAAARGVKG